jgi:hypothetical protein
MSSRRGRRRRPEDGDEEAVEDIEYGIRRSRREVAWEYRDSSSLSPIERMEQDMFYNFADRMLEFSMLFRVRRGSQCETSRPSRRRS